MIRVCVLGSGSSGNCTWIGNGSSALLVDAGFSAKEVLARMAAAGIDPASVKGIVVSHEHTDHARGVGVVARRLGAPVFVNERTHARIRNVIGANLDIVPFVNGVPFELGSFGVTPFAIPHDAADPAAFVFDTGSTTLGHLTDAGKETFLMEERLAGLDYLVMESNHDPEMLKAGPYPWELKQRIASATGHLANGDCMALLARLVHPNLQGVTFAHLSETNNNPDLVRIEAAAVLDAPGVPYRVASQRRPEPVTTVE